MTGNLMTSFQLRRVASRAGWGRAAALALLLICRFGIAEDAVTEARDSARDAALAGSILQLAAADRERPNGTEDPLPAAPRSLTGLLGDSAAGSLEEPTVRAQRIIAHCREQFQAQVRDYTCLFFKRERIDGRLTPQYAMQLKVKTQPRSVYIKVQKPESRAGREAIYIEGRHEGKVLVHDIGWGKLLAGTLRLHPRSARAMEDCRHPITHAGLGHMLDTIAERWAVELTPEESEVLIRSDVRVGDRPCLLIVSTHTEKRPEFLFQSVRVYLDQELHVPLRFEAYDWPERPGSEPVLVEEYSFSRLQLNVGLGERDFDPSNAQYSFGRF